MTQKTRVLLLGRSLPIQWGTALQFDGDVACSELSTLGASDDGLLKRLEDTDLVCVWVGDDRELASRRVEDIASAASVPVVVFKAPMAHDPTDWCRLGAVMALEGPPRNDADAAALRDRIRWASKVVPVVHARPPRRWGSERRTPAVRTAPTGKGTPVVAIASSSGGPRALGQLVSELPSDFRATLLVVQHMGGAFLPQLAADLQRRCALDVRIATPGEQLGTPCVLLAPDGIHMELSTDSRLAFHTDRDGHSHVPSADVLLSSVANACGRAATGVVLTGIGTDGAEGALAIRSAGGAVFAQDEESCTVFGMPGAAVKLGAVDQLKTPTEIGRALAARYGKRVEP